MNSKAGGMCVHYEPALLCRSLYDVLHSILHIELQCQFVSSAVVQEL